MTRGLALRSAIQAGLITGVVMVYLVAVGLASAFARREVVTGFLSLGHLMLAIPPLAVGYIVAGRPLPTSRRLAHALTVGLAAGVLFAAAFLAAEALSPGIRTVLNRVSAALLVFVGFGDLGLEPGAGALLNVAIATGLALLGGLVRIAPVPVRRAVVGAATAEAAKAALGRVDLVGAGGTAASLAATLVDSGDLEHHPRVVLALAENAGDTLERALRGAGARCTRIDVYRTVPAPPAEPRRPLSALRVDNVVLASPSAVTGFVHLVDVDAAVSVYTIGPSTTAAARQAGLAVTAEAREPSFEGIMEAMQWRN